MKPVATAGRVLRMLFWETTIRCNLACAHCRRLESNEADVGDLSTAQAELLLEQLAQLGRRQPQMPVLVFSGGEPLCRLDLFRLIGKARQHGLIMALATNGTAINGEAARRIREGGIARVSVSLDGATADVHDRMRRISGAFDRAIEGVRHLRENQVPFQINVTLTKQNVWQLREIYGLAQSLGAAALHFFMLVPVGCGQALAQTDMLSPQQYELVLHGILALEMSGDMQMKVTCGPHYERVRRQCLTGNVGEATHRPPSKGCLAGLGVLFVNHRGGVYPCGYLPLNCGNILGKRLIDIWDGDEHLVRLRDTGALEGKCGRCEYKRVCGGCRARAFGMTGNAMGEEPFCAYIPQAAVDSGDEGRT